MRLQVAGTKGVKSATFIPSCVPTRNLSSSSIAGERRFLASLGMTEGGLSDWTESRTSPQIEGRHCQYGKNVRDETLQITFQQLFDACRISRLHAAADVSIQFVTLSDPKDREGSQR